MIVRIDEPTPNGGDYSIGIYQNDDGFECDIENATCISILEYTNEGECVGQTFGFCGSEKDLVAV